MWDMTHTHTHTLIVLEIKTEGILKHKNTQADIPLAIRVTMLSHVM